LRARTKPNKPYGLSDHIHVYDEWTIGKDMLTLGTLFKVKEERGTYKFRQYVDNTALDIQWIDCWSMETGEFRSFVASRFKSIYKGKYVKKSSTVAK
jgi:hypothetical protein